MSVSPRDSELARFITCLGDQSIFFRETGAALAMGGDGEVAEGGETALAATGIGIATAAPEVGMCAGGRAGTAGGATGTATGTTVTSVLFARWGV